MSITYRLATINDLALLESTQSGVFDNPVSAIFAREFLADPRHHLAMALDGDQIVGFASAVHYLHPDKAPQLWINEVGVTECHRRQGIGQQLLHCLFEHARLLNCQQAWVLTEGGNEAACRLYASLPGVRVPKQAVMFEFDL